MGSGENRGIREKTEKSFLIKAEAHLKQYSKKKIYPLIQWNNMPCLQLDNIIFFEKYPFIRYGLPASLLSCIFGLILFTMTAELLIYGNYNNALGRIVPVYFYFMSITASLLAAYNASRGDSEKADSSKRRKALSGMLAALFVTLLPVLIYICLSLSIIDNMLFDFMIALQLCFAPLPAAILGSLIGYFIDVNPVRDEKEGIRGYIIFVSAVLLLELAVFLILVYGAVGMGFVPYDPGRVIPS